MALAVFVVYERRRESRGLPVLLDTDLFRIHAFRIGNAVAALWVVSGAGVVLLSPPLMHLALGYGAIEVGLMVSPLALGAAVLGVLSGEVGRRLGPIVTLLVGLAAMVVASIWLLAVLSPSMSHLSLGAPLALYGAGIGFSYAHINDLLFRDLPLEKSAMAGGIAATVRLGIGALATAALTVVFLTAGIDAGRSYLAHDPQLTDVQRVDLQRRIEKAHVDHAGHIKFGTVTHHPITADTHLKEPDVGIALGAYRALIVHAFRWILGIATAFLAIAFAVTWRAKRRMTQAERAHEA